MGDRYIVGSIGQLAVSTEPPHVGKWPQQVGPDKLVASFKTERGNRCHFTVKRGKCQEFNAYGSGEHMYCRIVPPDAIPALDRYDAIIADLESRLAHAKAERQEYLTACVQRGAAVRIEKKTNGH